MMVRTSEMWVAVVLSMTVGAAVAPPVEAQPRCRGTKVYYNGACRYPKEVDLLKEEQELQKKADEAARQAAEAARQAAELKLKLEAAESDKERLRQEAEAARNEQERSRRNEEARRAEEQRLQAEAATRQAAEAARQLEMERARLREQQRQAEEKLRQAEAERQRAEAERLAAERALAEAERRRAEAERLAEERARAEAETAARQSPPVASGFGHMTWCSYDVPGCSPESERLGYEVEYDKEKAFLLRKGGDYKEAMRTAWHFLENVPGLPALERGRLNYELAYSWNALGCEGNGCYHLRESLKFRPQSGRGWKITCEKCEEWGCPHCPGCR